MHRSKSCASVWMRTRKDDRISGAKGRNKLPGLDRLLKDATARKINVIAAWSVRRERIRVNTELAPQPHDAMNPGTVRCRWRQA
jgi:hypothetical protein